MPTTLRLPLAAVLCVLVGAVLLVATRPGAAGDGAGLRVVGAAGSFVVGARWSRTSPDAVLYYADDAGRPAVGLSGAVVADAGWCAGLPTSTRGFAGFTEVAARPGGRVLDGVAREVAVAWAGGVSGRAPPRVEVTATSLVDGGAAARATVRLRARPSTDPCLARRVVLDVVAFGGAGGGAVTAFVLVRDVDPVGIGASEVEAVVQSLRSRT